MIKRPFFRMNGLSFRKPRRAASGRVESPHDILRRLAALATSLLWAQDEDGKTE